MEFHEYANKFPMMGEEKFKWLVNDIKQNGLMDVIYTYEGKILDGRNRYKACLEAGVEPRFQKWNGEHGSIGHFVFAKNAGRRDLTASQRSMIAMEFEPILAEEAKKRMLAGKKANPTPISEEGSKGETLDKLAAMAKVGHGTMGLAAKIKKRGTQELSDAVKDGKIPVNVASEISELPAKEQKKMVTAGNIEEMRAKAREIERSHMSSMASISTISLACSISIFTIFPLASKSNTTFSMTSRVSVLGFSVSVILSKSCSG